MFSHSNSSYNIQNKWEFISLDGARRAINFFHTITRYVKHIIPLNRLKRLFLALITGECLCVWLSLNPYWGMEL